MENQNNKTKITKKNYQVIQETKERKLHAKSASLNVEILKTKELISNQQALLEASRAKIEACETKIADIKNSESEELKQKRQELQNVAARQQELIASLNETNNQLKDIIDEKYKQTQDSPRLFTVKSRLAYLNAEVSDSENKISEYKKEAKRELTLKASIQKLKAQEEKLTALVSSGNISSTHNYAEELEIATKQRIGLEKDLESFVVDENHEIARLSDISAEMKKEIALLEEELVVLKKKQSDATLAMQKIENEPAIIEFRAKIAKLEAENAECATKQTSINEDIDAIKAREQEQARQNGKEAEYLSLDSKITEVNNEISTINAEIAKTDAKLSKLSALLLKSENKLQEVKASILDCDNYNAWVENNKVFSDEMYPKALEIANKELREDREEAKQSVLLKIQSQARLDLGDEIKECVSKAERIVSQRKIQPKGPIKNTIVDSLANSLIERRVNKYIDEFIDLGKFEVYNEALKKLRDERLAVLEKNLQSAEQKLKNNKIDTNIKVAYENAKQAKEMFLRAETDNTLLVIRNLRKYFPVEKSFFGKPTRYLKAVDDVSLRVGKGKTLGIVGESGCGKTTMGRTVLKLHEITDGEIIFNGHHLEQLNASQMRALRTDLQIIFQDPYSSLSPRLPIGEIIGEAVKAHKLVPMSEYKDYIISVMKSCGLQPHHFSRFPHEFSGGQRQRICIARALAVNPKVVICDEPVSALDVSIQAQIINLLKDLQKTRNLTYIFISHDLSVVEHISDDVGVMYLGSMVESGPKEKIFDNPMHPYTEALMSAVPVPDPNVKMNRIFLKGDIPSPSRPPRGCKFHTRCHKCMEICKTMPPVYREYEKDHFVACHLYPQK